MQCTSWVLTLLITVLPASFSCRRELRVIYVKSNSIMNKNYRDYCAVNRKYRRFVLATPIMDSRKRSYAFPNCWTIYWTLLNNVYFNVYSRISLSVGSKKGNRFYNIKIFCNVFFYKHKLSCYNIKIYYEGLIS